MNDSFCSIAKLPEFDNHKLILFIYDEATGLEGFIAIHRGNHKIPSFGATRLWNYSSEEALMDALRLSQTMSYKAALANLKCGGAKSALISKNFSEKSKSEMFKSYAKKVNILRGKFITGADVGLDTHDVKFMRRFSPYFVGINVDPVRYTGLGLLYSIQACLNEVFGSERMEGRTFAIQGVGKIGAELLKIIYPYAKEVYIADIDNSRLKFVKRKFPKVKVSDVSDIHKLEVDVFSPCALYHCINTKNFRSIRSQIIVGGANCQLEKPELSEYLHKSGILYSPDYVVNAGGLISVFDEYESGNTRVKRVSRKVKDIKETMKRILRQSKLEKKAPLEIANRMAEKVFNSY